MQSVNFWRRVQRRKEKFSTPLIYDEEIKEEEKKPKDKYVHNYRPTNI